MQIRANEWTRDAMRGARGGTGARKCSDAINAKLYSEGAFVRGVRRDRTLECGFPRPSGKRRKPEEALNNPIPRDFAWFVNHHREAEALEPLWNPVASYRCEPLPVSPALIDPPGSPITRRIAFHALAISFPLLSRHSHGDDTESISRISTPASYHRSGYDNKYETASRRQGKETRGPTMDPSIHLVSPPPLPLLLHCRLHFLAVSLLDLWIPAWCKGTVPASWL